MSEGGSREGMATRAEVGHRRWFGEQAEVGGHSERQEVTSAMPTPVPVLVLVLVLVPVLLPCLLCLCMISLPSHSGIRDSRRQIGGVQSRLSCTAERSGVPSSGIRDS